MTTSRLRELTTNDNVLSLLALRVKFKVLVVEADEAAGWPPGVLDQLVSDGWLRPIEAATAISCDACHYDHVEEVIFLEEPPGSPIRAYIPCPENGRIRIPFDRLRRWEIDGRQFENECDAAAKVEVQETAVAEVRPVVRIGKYWMRTDGVTGFSTKTDDQKDGRVIFRLGDAGKMTMQAKLLQILCLHHPKPVRAIQLVSDLYPDESANVGKSLLKSDRLFHKFAGLVSDLRSRLSSEGINREIIPAMTKSKVYHASMSLRLAYLHRFSEKKPRRQGYTSSTAEDWLAWDDPEYDEEMGFVSIEED